MYFLSSRCESLDMSTFTTRQGMLEQDVQMIFRLFRNSIGSHLHIFLVILLFLKSCRHNLS